jgi:hypothetical protein
MRQTMPRAPRYLEELSVSRAFRLLSRGLRLRCPHCGEGRIRAGWLSLRSACAACGLRTDSGEQDFFLGGMMWNIVFAEGLLLLMGVAIGNRDLARCPMGLDAVAGSGAHGRRPFAFYPFSLGFWLACDIMIRPVTEEELEWYRTHDPAAIRSYRDR